jgi:hypothetical protein
MESNNPVIILPVVALQLLMAIMLVCSVIGPAIIFLSFIAPHTADNVFNSVYQATGFDFHADRRKL